MRKHLIVKNRRRFIQGGFSFIPHRFLRDGYFEILRNEELLLYFFFVMVADSQGLSYYRPPTITKRLKINKDAYEYALQGLINLDLIAVDDTLVQVLQLPESPSFSNASSEEFL